MQTRYTFGRFCRIPPREGATENLKCLSKTRYYSMTPSTGPEKSPKQIRNKQGDTQSKPATNRGRCVSTHLGGNFCREDGGHGPGGGRPPTGLNAVGRNSWGLFGGQIQKRRRCLDQRHFADAPNLFAKQSEKQAACLFPRKDRILHCFSDAEFQRGFRGDLDSFASGRVAAFARFPV